MVTLFRGTGTAAYEYLESHPLTSDDYFLEVGTALEVESPPRGGAPDRPAGELDVDASGVGAGQVADQLVESRWGGDLILCNQFPAVAGPWASSRTKPPLGVHLRLARLVQRPAARQPRSVGRRRYLRRAPGGSTGLVTWHPGQELCPQMARPSSFRR